MSSAVIIGRFQPLHDGHVKLIKKATDTHDKVLVLIGSSNKLPCYNNPFTYEQRKQLIETLDTDLIIKPLPDLPNDEEWIGDVVSRMLTLEENPDDITIYSGAKDAEWYRKSFVSPVVAVTSDGISATEVRDKWYHGSLVDDIPPVTHAFLSSVMMTDEYHRLRDEYFYCTGKSEKDHSSHAFGNPIEPVAHAVVIQNNKVLCGIRNGVRGRGQLALPGGYVDSTETTRAAALRELHEETGVDLMQYKAGELAFAVEENMDDLSTRTIGHNFLYIVHPDEKVQSIAGDDLESIEWVSLEEILKEETLLFYNHNRVVQRLISIYNQEDNK